MSELPQDDGTGVLVAARSFVVRALLEDVGRAGREWHGFVTDAQTGARRAWRTPGEAARFIEHTLAAETAAGGPSPGTGRIRGVDMAGPPLTDVVSGMLALLGQHLPAAPPGPPVPVSNVTLERIAEKLVGLGDQAGTEPTGTLGVRTLRGGRLDARVRFQVWAASPGDVDDAMRTLHADLLDAGEHLRSLGFLRLRSTDTTLAEHVGTIPAWRKATSVDVLYEYRYTDSDDAASLIARIPVTSDLEAVAGGATEHETVVDELVRWDQEDAAPLIVRGPAAVTRVAALAFVPGPPLGGTVSFRRLSGAVGPVVPFADLDTFLAATTGDAPTHLDAEVTLDPAAALGALGPASPGPDLGDWDTDGTPDSYTGTDRRLDAPLRLPAAVDRFEIRYAPPPGPATGLDQTAVVYLRVNPP
jgi:hypothetical protein